MNSVSSTTTTIARMGRARAHRDHHERNPFAMAFKARVLIPAGALIAAVVAAASCAPPSPPTLPPPTPPPTTGGPPPPQPTCPSAGTDATPGPNSQNPISSWGINGTGYSVVTIGDIVYVGGTFSQAVSPTGQNVAHADLAAFCIKDRLPGLEVRGQHERSGVGPDHRREEPVRRGQLHVDQRPAHQPAGQARPEHRHGRHDLQPAGHPRRGVRPRLPLRQRQHLRRR